MKMNGANNRKINFWFMFDDPLPSGYYCPWCLEGIMDRHGGSLICRECQTIMPAPAEREAA